MNKEELAKRLDGRLIGNEISKEEEANAQDDGLIVIFGSSDDLAEIRGAIYDEVGCYDGGVIAFYKGELLTKSCSNDDCPHEEVMLEKSKIIKALWCPDDDGVSWKYETGIPHAKFDIIEDNEVYCRGIVISYKDIKS